MKYHIRFSILFSPQLLAVYDQIYILHIYSQMCHFVSSKKECVVAYTFLQDIFVPRLICLYVPNLSPAHNGK